MQRQDFQFDLPQELIAKYPLDARTDSRLLSVDRQRGELAHRAFRDLPDLLEPGDLLVLNNTKVLPARCYGKKSTGGRVEILVERVLGPQTCLAHIRASKAPKPGTVILLDDQTVLEVVGRTDALFQLQCSAEKTLIEILDAVGHMPLPPYIKREDTAFDSERYQTVYAQTQGAVAAPTAGLHFDEALFSRLEARGINKAFVTLHVGAGTFQPVRVDSLAEHVMHSEWLQVSAEVVDAVQKTKARGNRVIAVGTTAVRSLETAAQTGTLQPYEGETDLFLYPGHAEFRVVDAMITNFHLSESTLIMLVSAFASKELIFKAYQEAIAERYRFFSYGDAMFIA